jgi:hypothetical protein
MSRTAKHNYSERAYPNGIPLEKCVQNDKHYKFWDSYVNPITMKPPSLPLVEIHEGQITEHTINRGIKYAD